PGRRHPPRRATPPPVRRGGRPPGSGARAPGAAGLPPDERGGEPAPRGLLSRWLLARRRGPLRRGLRLLPRPRGTPPPSGRKAVGRRAAATGHRPGPAVG